MSTSLSAQERQRLGNPTRVDISYKVKDGTPIKRIPFRAGVMANLSGHTEDLPPLEDREFVSIDRKNFDTVMNQMKPSLTLDVDDTLEGGDQQFSVNLNFNEFADFGPERLIMQIPRLKALFEKREKLMAAKRDMADPKVAKLTTEAMKQAGGQE